MTIKFKEHPILFIVVLMAIIATIVGVCIVPGLN